MIGSSEFSRLRLLTDFLKDTERKSITRIIIDLVYLFIKYRELPYHYFSRYLFKKDRRNIADYLPNNFLYKIKSKFNEIDVSEVLENKLYFDFFYRQFNINLPKNIMYNQTSLFVFNNERFEVKTTRQFSELLQHVFESTTEDSLFIKKTSWSYEGKHIYKVFRKDLDEKPDTIDTLFNVVIKSGYLFQHTIKQHKDLDAFNPSCLNTLRLDSFINKNGQVEIISAYLKTNVKNYYIDNDPIGGCEIPIDLQTGKLKKYGSLTIKYNGVKLPQYHPITKVRFENFTVPCFNEVKNLVVKVAGYMPGLRLVGWDVGIEETGPILIEGNSDYSIPASDLAYGGYGTNPIFKKILAETAQL